MHDVKQKSKETLKYRRVLTFGGLWSDLFEDSLSRKMSAIKHLKVGDPKFQLKEIDLEDTPDREEFLKRINSNNTQASELIWKFTNLINLSELILLDTKLLDTAIGQFLLSESKTQDKAVWAVGVDSNLSPLAPYYLKGVIYPATADDLVKLTLQELP